MKILELTSTVIAIKTDGINSWSQSAEKKSVKLDTNQQKLSNLKTREKKHQRKINI